MAPRRQEIYELEAKIKGLQTLAGHAGNFEAFCDTVSISRDGLRACLEAGTRGLSMDYQKCLAKQIGFLLTWPEWRETDQMRVHAGTRRDTAEAFIHRCRCELFGEETSVAERLTDVQLKRVRIGDPSYCDDQLATVELQASQSGPGQPWPISFDLTCNPSVIAGIEIAAKRGRLRFSCGQAYVDMDANIAHPNGYVCERATGDLRLTLGGTRQQPSLEIQASEGPIGRLSLPGDFFMVHQLAPGDVIQIRFLVYLMDLEIVEAETAVEPRENQQDADSLSFLRVGFRTLGHAKQKILKRIAEMQLPGGEKGLAVLASDQLRFELATKPVTQENADVS